MPARRRHLVARHGRDVRCRPRRRQRRRVVGRPIVLGGDREFDAFAGECHRALGHCGIAMATQLQRVNVRVHCDPARRGHLAAQTQRNIARLTATNGHRGFVHAVLGSARGAHAVGARQQADAAPAHRPHTRRPVAPRRCRPARATSGVSAPPASTMVTRAGSGCPSAVVTRTCRLDVSSCATGTGSMRTAPITTSSDGVLLLMRKVLLPACKRCCGHRQHVHEIGLHTNE